MLATGVLIFLHGFGDQARGFVSALPTLLKLPEVRYVLPTAPQLGGAATFSSIFIDFYGDFKRFGSTLS